MKAPEKCVTPDKLFAWADKYARKMEESGRGTQYPTFKQATNRFKVNLDAIEDACNEGLYDDRYLGAGVGVRTGSGIGLHKHRGDWVVEAYA